VQEVVGGDDGYFGEQGGVGRAAAGGDAAEVVVAFGGDAEEFAVGRTEADCIGAPAPARARDGGGVAAAGEDEGRGP